MAQTTPDASFGPVFVLAAHANPLSISNINTTQKEIENVSQCGKNTKN